MNGLADPTDIVVNMMRSAKKFISRPTITNDCLISDNVVALCDLFRKLDDLIVLRDLTTIVIGFFSSFLRYVEISSLKCNDIHFVKAQLISIEMIMKIFYQWQLICMSVCYVTSLYTESWYGFKSRTFIFSDPLSDRNLLVSLQLN